MFGLEFILIVGLDMLGRLISIPSATLGIIEKIRLNLVAAATAIWVLIRKLSDESRAITLTVRLERQPLTEEDSSTRSESQAADPHPSLCTEQSPPS